LMQECDSRGIELNLEFDSSKFLVEFDIQQIEQVLVNVIKNSIEAVDSNGWIILKTSSSDHRLEVIDNGVGINDDDRKNIFTPFYSTKKTGQGIGLTLTREILINHGFKFGLESLKKKTVFYIEFK